MYGLALGLMASAGNALNSPGSSTGSPGKASDSGKLDRFFERLDTNKDGRISQAEFMVSGQNLQPGSAESTTGSTAEGAASTNSAGARRNLFKAMDSDGDGNISKEEAAAFSAQKTAARAALLSIQEQFGGGQNAARTGQRRHPQAGAVASAQTLATIAPAAGGPASASVSAVAG
ncbi:EF-hand domain-containing protein [Phreatobacter stygius]|uniref:EF-hand domain-containing protein n=1 Tax=Phreatobacter stygius TaxID=1940610 RepID=A0A4D7AX30_9HYPH|nr:EF-hand domain-containing protein [Phreatobacter stygius]QCI65739.1 EF-hand domain-containing protein [Phreatobacter stygius]